MTRSPRAGGRPRPGPEVDGATDRATGCGDRAKHTRAGAGPGGITGSRSAPAGTRVRPRRGRRPHGSRVSQAGAATTEPPYRACVDLSSLGAPLGPMARVHGGFANRLYRLDTDQGSFAVKELNLVDRRWPYRLDDVFGFEQAAFAAGIPMPEPISASRRHARPPVGRGGEGARSAGVAGVRVRDRWDPRATSTHSTSTWTPRGDRGADPRDWPELAERAAATGQPWADELASQVETFLAIARFVDTCERPGPVVLTHQRHPAVEPARPSGSAGGARLGALGAARPGR